MKLTVSTAMLLEALRKVVSVVSTRSTIPVLANVLLVGKDNQLSLSTTDLEVSITTTLDANIEREGEITLPAKKFNQIIGSLPGGDVTLDTDDTATNISCGPASFKVMGLEATEFPKESDFEEDRKVTFPSLEFGKTLRKISYAVSVDQTRLVLNGLLLSIRDGNFIAVATDGRRLALVEKILEDADSAEDGDVILPIKVVHELERLLDEEGEVIIRQSEARASFNFGSTTLVTKLVEGSYPNYRQVIPASFKNSVTLPREKFLEVLNRVSVVVTENGSSVKMDLGEDNLKLSASSTDVGEAEEPIEVSFQGDPVNIAFNPQFLRDPLKQLEADDMTIRFNDEFKPVVLLGDEGFLYVIMPMRN